MATHTNTTISYDATTQTQTCAIHGSSPVARCRAGAFCWQCDGKAPGCEHLGARAEVTSLLNGSHSWRMHPCPTCQAAQDDARREREAAAALAKAEAEQARRATIEAREAEIARQLRRGEVALVAQYRSRCAECDAPIRPGTRIAHNRSMRATRHLLGCRPETNTFNCRYCGEPVIGGQSSFGGWLCPMSDGGEQPHRA